MLTADRISLRRRSRFGKKRSCCARRGGCMYMIRPMSCIWFLWGALSRMRGRRCMSMSIARSKPEVDNRCGVACIVVHCAGLVQSLAISFNISACRRGPTQCVQYACKSWLRWPSRSMVSIEARGKDPSEGERVERRGTSRSRRKVRIYAFCRRVGASARPRFEMSSRQRSM